MGCPKCGGMRFFEEYLSRSGRLVDIDKSRRQNRIVVEDKIVYDETEEVSYVCADCGERVGNEEDLLAILTGS